MSEAARNLSKISDFIIKVIIMFSIVPILLFFANEYNPITYGTLLGIYLVAIIIKGSSDIFNK